MATLAEPLILASASPRRREILAGLGLEFSVEPSGVAEVRSPAEAPAAYAARLASEKALDVARRQPGRLVVGADTIVVVDGRVLEKPRDDGEAVSMLEALAGRTHQVLTAVALVRDAAVIGERLVQTDVTFRRLSAQEIAGYVATGEGRDKAGGYAVQGLGAGFVTGIVGSYHNVVGLPSAEMLVLLQDAGVLTSWP